MLCRNFWFDGIGCDVFSAFVWRTYELGLRILQSKHLRLPGLGIEIVKPQTKHALVLRKQPDVPRLGTPRVARRCRIKYSAALSCKLTQRSVVIVMLRSYKL